MVKHRAVVRDVGAARSSQDDDAAATNSTYCFVLQYAKFGPDETLLARQAHRALKGTVDVACALVRRSSAP